MKKISKFLSILLAASMIFSMLPALSAGAADGGNFMEIVGSGNNSYLSTVGSNAFNVLMYNNTFSGTFGDQHMGGIELSLNGMRIATNGDLHLLPTPEQWDATPAPSRGSRVHDTDTGTITIPMTFNGATDGTLRYDLIAASTDKGMKLSMVLTSDMPESLKGKARFNLELRPASYKNKSFQADLNGDGVYDSFGIFPLHPQDAMIETERPDLPSQAWYVKDWNEQRGDDQPAPFATAYGFSLSPEDEETAITFTSNTDDKIELLDGRNRAQNGWYVLSTVISATKAGEVASEWIVEPNVKEGWVREPNVGFSQVGYTPGQEKFAVVELDKWDNDYPKTMSLWRVNADGSEENVCEKELGATSDWMRFKYARFDFTEVTQAGLYRIHYGDYVGEIFPIAKNVYDRIWHTTLSGFLAVQMDHIVVREGYKIWHGASHMDDGVIGDRSSSWFDGMQMQPMPQPIRDRGYKGEDHIDGLNKGGWFDAGDFDLQISRNVQVLGDLVNAGEICGRADNYDDLYVEWDDETGGLVEMHRPDGIPDVVQQCIHGSKQLLAEYECLGGTGGCMEVRYLRQYTHLGDPSSDTDGWIYDSSLKEGEVVERDGKVYSGVPDDRYFLTAGGGGSFSAGLSQGLVNSFAGTAYMAVDYPATQEYAQHLFNVCIDRWKASNWSSNWDTVVQFALASDAFEKAGVAYDDQDTLSAAYFKGLLDALIPNNLNANSHINVLALKHLLTEEQWAQVGESVANVNVSVNNQPYGVNFTTGASWGGSPNTYSGVRNISYMYYHFPLKKFEQNILRSVNYLLGRHPATNSSWISGVGTKSMLHPYNSNRAEESYIPGSILPGHITFGDYVESMDDFNFLWFENESIINYQSSWLPVGIAAGHIAANEADPEPAATKDFESSFNAELVTKTTSSGWGQPSTDGYFADDGFNVFMYSTQFDRGFGDQHCAGIELIQNGRRIATNGDIHLLPTPEQWDATPAPQIGTRTFDEETKTVTVPITMPAETFEDGTENPAVNYQLIATPEPGGIKLTVKLDAPLPADVVGKAGFNLEFLPAVFIGKSYQADSDGDGVYDDFGVFPKDPRDQMEDVDRARTNNQEWYVKEWNEQRGNAQPVAFSTGTKMTFAAEDDDYRIRISCDDGLALYDGRNRAQNGWFVLRTLIPADKTEIVWHISPDTNENWVREPNITHNQAGYEPELSKVAVIELDPKYVGSNEAKLLKLESDGSFTEVLSKPLGEAKTWQRYVYRDFDFTEVKARGTYAIEYDGVRSETFPIDKHVYKDIYTESIGNYMAVQMDHMRIREGYKIWRNAAHMDDALQAPAGMSWFDAGGGGTTIETGYEPYERIPGLDVGGYSDAGDFDIQVGQNLAVINALALAYQVYGNDYDTLDINWETNNVELHRSDDVPDLIQLAKHGALNIAAQLENIGFLASVFEVPTLRQYTHLGDGSKDTDNLYYDASLAEDEVDGRRSGKRDDRLAFAFTKSASSQMNAIQAIASTASILPDSDPDKARFIALAEKVWAEEPESHEGVETTISFGQWSFTSGPVDWNAAIELYNATGKDVYKNRILELLDYEMGTEGGGGGIFGGGAPFASGGWRLVKILDKLGDEVKAKYEAALAAYAPNIGVPNASNPYGVADTMGMWGGSGTVVSNALMASVLHKYYPEVVSADSVFRAIDYILGTHPYTSTSWISGVGTKSLEKGYGSNRADFYYIAGGLAPGYVTIAPDFPEALDDFNFLWFENEYTVEVTANWILLTLGADDFAREADVPCEHDWQTKVTEPTCTKGGYTTYFCNKCFESYVGDYTDALGHDFDDGVITKQPTQMFDGVKTYTCRRCGTTYKEPIPKLPAGDTNNVSIDFTKAADAGKYEILGQETAEVVEGEGVTLVSLMGGVEPAKRSIEERERDVIEVPLNEDWISATLRFDFDSKGAGGAWAFFGFYAAEGEGYQNMLGIRGGDGAMQNFERHDGVITHEDEDGVNSAPGLSRAGEYILQIAKSEDTYTCYRSDDGGETFVEMFSYDASGINADKLVIDAYSGRDEGFTFVMKALDIEYPGGGAASKIIDFKNPADNDKYEIVGETAAEQTEAGLVIKTTRNAIEDCNGQNSGEQATTPEDLIAVPVSGDWTATLQFNFDPTANNGYYQFFGMYAAQGDDYQNMAGIRGGDGALQNFLRKDGAITADSSDLNSAPGLASAGTYWYQIVKAGDTYTCFRSADGEEFTEMFSYEGTGIEADRIIIDAYTGMTAGYTFTLDTLIVEGVGGAMEWVETDTIEPGQMYIIVASDAYALSGVEGEEGVTSTPVTVDGYKVTSEVTSNMVWVFEPAEGVDAAADGAEQYFLVDGDDLYLRRGSGNAGMTRVEFDAANARYFPWSLTEREEEEGYTLYVNGSTRYALSGTESGFSVSRVSSSSGNIKTAGTPIKLYTLTGGGAPQPKPKPEVSGITVDGKAIEGFDPKVKAYAVGIADGVTAVPAVAATAGNKDTKITVTQAAGIPGEAVIEAVAGEKSLVYTVSFDYGPKDDYFADGAMNEGQWTILNEVKNPTEEEPYKYYRFDKGVGLVMPTQHNSIYQKATPGAWSNMFTMSGGGDWEVVAKAFYPVLPDGNYQQVQFIAWQDEDNYVRINVQDNRRRTEPFYEKAGTAVNQNANAVNDAIPLAEDGTMTMYFKINKAGNTYTLSYSEDGLTWKSGGVYEAALTNVKVAVFCTQDYQPTQSNYKVPVELAYEYVAVTSRDGKAVRSDAETLTWAAQNAADYIAADLPDEASEDLTLSAAPHGYTVELSSSDPAVIDADGKVVPAEDDKDVTVTVTVSEGETSASAAKTIRVPGTGGSVPGALKLGPNVIKDPESPTGYTVKFLYDNPTASSVTFNGDIMLRDDENRGGSQTFTPFEYRPGLMRAGGWNAPMEKRTFTIDGEEKEVWYIEVPLAAGANQYWFTVPGSNAMIPDPANTPIWSPTATQRNGYNYVYVPYDEKQDYAPMKAREAELPRTDGKSGDWGYVPIEIGGRTHHMGVYTPYGYVPKGTRAAGGPYKLIFVLHGYGQDESDWMNIGSVQKIMDNLVAEGRTEPAVIVSVTTNNNMIGGTGDNYANLMNVIIPYLEENYNIAPGAENRAFCGLSMGAMNTMNIINGGADRFAYYAPMSGGMSVRTTAPGLEKTHIMFGSGWSDTTVRPDPNAYKTLTDAGYYAVYEEVTGGHDFNAWCQLFRIFLDKYAWNPAAFGDTGTPGEIDTAALEKAISDADGINKADYTDESVAALEAAYAAAKDALGSDDQAVIDSAAAALNDAIKALVKKPVEPTGDLKLGPNVIKDPESPTGYTVKFLYKNDEATAVNFNGDISLRNDADRSDTRTYDPTEYRPGLMRGAGYSDKPMEKRTFIIDGEETEVWYYEVPLACGANQYWFTLPGNSAMIPDPANTPIWSPTAQQRNGYNYVYIPYDEKQDYEVLKLREAENPRADKKGTWSYVPVEIDGTTHHMGVYLPYGYDAEREQPYKTIWILHGGGQDESDWMNIGSVQNIMDNLAAEGRTEPAVIVSPTTNANMMGGTGDAYANLFNVLIPFMEEHYNVSSNKMDRALGGLSMGSMNTQNIINANTTAEKFGYYGPWSGGVSVQANAVGIEYAHILFAGGSNDFGWSASAGQSVESLINQGVYADYMTVTGAHDFNTWCQMFRIWCEDYLWNPAAFGDGGETDTAALEAKIAEAEAIDTTPYTDRSVANLNNAIEAAKAVVAEPLNQRQIDRALADLENAIARLKVKPAPSADGSYVLASAVEAGKSYVIVADDTYALNGEATEAGTLGATEVAISGDAITSAVTPDMVWTFAAAEGAEAAIDGSDLYFITNADGSYLSRSGNNLALADAIGETLRYFTWSLTEREEGDDGFTFFCNGNSSGAASRYAVTGAETGFVSARVSNSSGNIKTAGSSVKLYEKIESASNVIDFTNPADASKYEIAGQSQSEVEEGEGLALIATQGGVEPAKQSIAEQDIDVVKVPVSGDWTATLEVEFDANGAANGYYQFFGFYGSQGGDNQNMVGIRGGDGAMQDFIRKDGAITEELQSSAPGFDTTGKTYFLRIEKSGDDYVCYRSDDGEDFTEMFSYTDTGIEPDEIIIDAYTGMTANYKFILKTLTIEGAGGETPPPPKPDYTALEAAIAAAEAVEKDKYTDASVAAMETALAAAKEALKADKQADVDAAAAALDNAVKALEEKPTPVINKVALQAAIAAAEAINKSSYTDETVAAMEAALAAAKEAMNADTQAAVDAATKALNDAVAALELKPIDNPDLEELYRLANEALRIAQAAQADAEAGLQKALAAGGANTEALEAAQQAAAAAQAAAEQAMIQAAAAKAAADASDRDAAGQAALAAQEAAEAAAQAAKAAQANASAQAAQAAAEAAQAAAEAAQAAAAADQTAVAAALKAAQDAAEAAEAAKVAALNADTDAAEKAAKAAADAAEAARAQANAQIAAQAAEAAEAAAKKAAQDAADAAANAAADQAAAKAAKEAAEAAKTAADNAKAAAEAAKEAADSFNTGAAEAAAAAAAQAAKVADALAEVTAAQKELVAAKAELEQNAAAAKAAQEAAEAALAAAEAAKLGAAKYLAKAKLANLAAVADVPEEHQSAYDDALAAGLAAIDAAKDVDAVEKAREDTVKALNDIIDAYTEPFRFDDVKDAGKYYYNPVYWAYEREPQITTGTSDTLFSPDAPCTRAQVVTFLWRAANQPEPKGDENPFVDVSADAYYYKAVLWAVEEGIAKGTTETTFRPDQTCTRGQIMTFLWRYMEEPAPKSENPFVDVAADAYYADAIAWGAENNIAKGITETEFRPDETCTRGQIVTFLYRAMP